MYGASVTLGVGGSTLLVTVLTMLADLIGDNVVRILDRDSCFVLLLVFTFCCGQMKVKQLSKHFLRTKSVKSSAQLNVVLLSCKEKSEIERDSN